MDTVVPLLLSVGIFAGCLGGCVWLALRARRSGAAGAAIRAALAAHDEAFKVTSHESYYEVQALSERKAPLLVPDEEWRARRTAVGSTATGGPTLPRPRPRTPLRRLRRRVARLGRRGR